MAYEILASDCLPGSYDASRALTWLGYRATHEEHQLTFSKVLSHCCPSLFVLRGPDRPVPLLMILWIWQMSR